jgi:hypothetical protein
MEAHSRSHHARPRSRRQGRLQRALQAAALALAVLSVPNAGEFAAAPDADPVSSPPLPAAAAHDARGVVRYELDGWLDHGERTVQGKGRVIWRNTSPDPIGELQLHLYMNAFKNSRTTFMKESGGSHRSQKFYAGAWGWIDLLALELPDGSDLLENASFIRPDDGNEEDETVLRVPLAQWIEPGGEIELDMLFATRLPRVFARTGYSRDFYLVGQWFPKMCVYESEGMRGREAGGWNCHQFHSNGEFYADYGSYDVSITVPEGFVVGATGRLAGPPEATSGGAVKYRYLQDDVHDFAWTADPDFIEEKRSFRFSERRDPDEERRMARVLGLDASRIPDRGAEDLSGVPPDLRLGDVEVTLLLQPEHRGQAGRHFEAAFNAILYFGYWYGAYPYGTLTVVDPAWAGRGAGGMEYPTFITAGARWIAPAWRHEPESVTIHEYGHQYWYGLVGNNEFEEAWLDEGLDTYSTGRLLEKAYGPNYPLVRVNGIPLRQYPFFQIPRDADPNDAASVSSMPDGSPSAAARLLYLRWAGASNEPLLNIFRDLPFLTQPSDVPVEFFQERRARYHVDAAGRDRLALSSWEFVDRSSYSGNVYSRTAVMLDSLRRILGEDRFDRGMRLFHQRFRYRHPSTDDFVATMSEAAGEDLSWFFDQVIRGSGLLDYAVSEATSKAVPAAFGSFGPPADRTVITPEEAAGEGSDGPEVDLESVVTVIRRGAIRFPMQIELVFEGGRRDAYEWDGQYRWHRIRETGPDRLVRARVGPAEGLSLEAGWADNARTVEADRWPALKWWTRMVGWIQNVLYFYSGIA